MSTTVHSPSPTDYLSFRSRIPDATDSPFTPFRPTATATPRKPLVTAGHSSPVLLLTTPSPFRRRMDSGIGGEDYNMQLDFDDFAGATDFSTPYRPRKTTNAQKNDRLKLSENPHSFRRPPRPPPDDDDDGLFLRSDVGHTSLPLRTPVRHPFEVGMLSTSAADPKFSHAPKRKINLVSSSPNLTPLRIHQPADDSENQRFATLAPLPAPFFLNRRGTPDSNVKRQVDSMKQMRLTDRTVNLESDSSSEEDEFSSIKVRKNGTRLVRPSTEVQEVVESVSPGGHITKRRTRSRPVSLELMQPPADPIVLNTAVPTNLKHRRNGSETSVSETGSPRKMSLDQRTGPEFRPEFGRMASAATLFFGPAIVHPASDDNDDCDGPARSSSFTLPPATPGNKSTAGGNDPFNAVSPDSSFTSAFGRPGETSFAFSVTAISPQNRTSSPRERIPKKFKKPRDSGVALSDDEADNFLKPLYTGTSTDPQPSTSYSTSSEATLFDESFVTPCHEPNMSSGWPKSLDVSTQSIDEFIVKTLVAGAKDGGGAPKRMPTTPQKRTKTAFLGLPAHRPWASAVASKMTYLPDKDQKLPKPNFGSLMDSGSSAGSLRGTQSKDRPRKSCPSDMRFPSVDMHLSRSEVVDVLKSSVSSNEAEISPSRTHIIPPPRHRTYGDVGMGLPGSKLSAQFLLRRSSSGAFSSSSEASDGSHLGTPTRKAGDEWRTLPLKPQYTPANNTVQLAPVTPTSFTNQGTGSRHSISMRQLPIFPKHSAASKENRKPEQKPSGLPISGIPRRTSNMRFPTQPTLSKTRPQPTDVRNIFWNRPPDPQSTYEQPGRFERDFDEVDSIGSGEFGSAIKVRYKHAHGQRDQVYAVKKSKCFEGNRHRTGRHEAGCCSCFTYELSQLLIPLPLVILDREHALTRVSPSSLRLREEVEVLQHLSAAAGPGFHPNVLGYVDSWEEDDRLFILTELCEFGNFAHFLSEYGHHFARLDEARVWKIFSDISSGLHFIHRADICHFDLKPANVFITASGRFKIGDFGMASKWPRPLEGMTDASAGYGKIVNGRGQAPDREIGFEREGDKMYLAAEVLQGKYGKETDIFSFGMMMLETAANIVVPTQGELWHRLREEDFSPVDGFEEECSNVLVRLIKSMMLKNSCMRPTAEAIYGHFAVSRARARMAEVEKELRSRGEVSPEALFKASPLAGVEDLDDFLQDILGSKAGAVAAFRLQVPVLAGMEMDTSL